MTTQKTAQETAESITGHGIVDLDARLFRATVGLVSQAGLLDQIVAMLGRSPAWPELRPGERLP
jgi:hypothetical protein